MPVADPPADLPERTLRVLTESDDDVFSPGRVQRLLASDGIDVASSAVRTACETLVEEGHLSREAGPRYRLVTEE